MHVEGERGAAHAVTPAPLVGVAAPDADADRVEAFVEAGDLPDRLLEILHALAELAHRPSGVRGGGQRSRAGTQPERPLAGLGVALARPERAVTADEGGELVVRVVPFRGVD